MDCDMTQSKRPVSDDVDIRFDPEHWFRNLINSINASDFEGLKEAQQRLLSCGFSVVPVSPSQVCKADPQLSTPKEIAERLGVTVGTVRAWLNAGELRGIRISKPCARHTRYVIRERDLQEFLEGRRTVLRHHEPRRRKLRGNVHNFF